MHDGFEEHKKDGDDAVHYVNMRLKEPLPKTEKGTPKNPIEILVPPSGSGIHWVTKAGKMVNGIAVYDGKTADKAFQSIMVDLAKYVLNNDVYANQCEPQKVFDVWGDLKGFHDRIANPWDPPREY